MKEGKDSREEDEIYGYRYDPVLKRHFKIGGEPYRQVSQSTVTPKCPTVLLSRDKQSNIVMKYGNNTKSSTVSGFPQALQLREMGFTNDPNFSSSLVKIKLQQMKSSYNQKVSLTREIVTCDYVQGLNNYLVGAWSVNDGVPDLIIKGECVSFDQVANEISVDSYFSDENCIIARLHKNQVLRDMCVGYFNSDTLCIVYVSNSVDPRTHQSSAVCYSVTRLEEDYDVNLAWGLKFRHASQSCAFGSAKKYVAVGLESGVGIYSPGSMYQRFISLGGRPFSLNFSSDDNLLYCGLHNGVLLGVDLRATSHSPPALQLRLNRGLLNLKVLKNQTSMIASAFDDQLLNVDIRSKRVVFHYPHHVNSYKRLLPLSHDETWDVLCSPGQDNVTRLWSLKEGKLLLSVPAPLGDIKGNLHKSWFQPTPRGPLLHLWQGNSVYLYET